MLYNRLLLLFNKDYKHYPPSVTPNVPVTCGESSVNQ